MYLTGHTEAWLTVVQQIAASQPLFFEVGVGPGKGDWVASKSELFWLRAAQRFQSCPRTILSFLFFPAS